MGMMKQVYQQAKFELNQELEREPTKEEVLKRGKLIIEDYERFCSECDAWDLRQEEKEGGSNV